MAAELMTILGSVGQPAANGATVSDSTGVLGGLVAILIALVAVVGLLWAGWAMWRERPTPV